MCRPLPRHLRHVHPLHPLHPHLGCECLCEMQGCTGHVTRRSQHAICEVPARYRMRCPPAPAITWPLNAFDEPRDAMRDVVVKKVCAFPQVNINGIVSVVQSIRPIDK